MILCLVSNHSIILLSLLAFLEISYILVKSLTLLFWMVSYVFFFFNSSIWVCSACAFSDMVQPILRYVSMSSKMFLKFSALYFLKKLLTAETKLAQASRSDSNSFSGKLLYMLNRFTWGPTNTLALIFASDSLGNSWMSLKASPSASRCLTNCLVTLVWYVGVAAAFSLPALAALTSRYGPQSNSW